MALPVEHGLGGSARAVDRALRAVEDGAHLLRQKLLARRLARTLSPSEWTHASGDEVGLSADDLRSRSKAIRSAAPE